ncbi:MAG TPA: ATP-binding protein [Solirubrobacterales bacterium]|jgi:hypothetical protein
MESSVADRAGGAPPDGALSREEKDRAREHLADLATSVRPIPAETRTLSMPRLRRAWRRLVAEAEGFRVAAEKTRQAANAPHHPLGRLKVGMRLKLRDFLQPQVLAALALLAPVAAYRLVVQPSEGSLGAILSNVFFGVVVIGAVVTTWRDLVRSPWEAWRIRRRIIDRPASVLPTTSPIAQTELIGREEQVPIVPRADLYADVLPGILDPRRSDIQMLVGEPGAGKTTALVDLASRLARAGFVPVVVPIMGTMPDDLPKEAEGRFKQHAWSLVGSNARLEDLWHWLRQQGRVVIAIDDVDRIAPDGERGFILRRSLDELAAADLPALVTTRPAGIPAGLAAAAINLEDLDPRAAIEHVLRVASAEPGSLARGRRRDDVRGVVAQWVREGRFAEVPFYLELLARLVAVGRCEELAPAAAFRNESEYRGRVRQREDGECVWNPLWVRFLLLERFYKEVIAGRVHRWLAIESGERENCLDALSEAALATLAAAAIEARHGTVARSKIEQFLKSDDRSRFTPDGGRRRSVSAHEVIDTGERLRILDRDPDGELHFHHRIMQAYLAARCLARLVSGKPSARGRRDDWWMVEGEPLDWIGALLDRRFPDRLTAHMTLTFAAVRARMESSRTKAAACCDEKADDSSDLDRRIVSQLIVSAIELLSADDERGGGDDARLDPRAEFHPEGRRVDPDDALAKLTTAAEIAHIACLGLGDDDGKASEDCREPEFWQRLKKGVADHPEAPVEHPREAIVKCAREARGATLWTKLHAIPSIAALDSAKGWVCLWEFARDPDQEVRRAASEAIEADAFRAYDALQPWIDELLERAALRSDRDRSVESPDLHRPAGGGNEGGDAASDDPAEEDARLWKPAEHPLSLQALGWILPAIVSGLRETVAGTGPVAHQGEGGGPTGADDGAAGEEVRAAHVRNAREALERFVRLSFQGGQPELEASLAQGFKRDAMHHAKDPTRSGGPGLVANNRRLVTDLCVDNAGYWYARLVLHQALALYTIAGSDRRVALDTFGRLLRRGGEPHPFVWRGARLARRAVARAAFGSNRWKALIWADEGVAVSRRPAEMNRDAAQLVADITLLLNLREGSPEDRQAFFPHMKELPHCLSGSADRREVLGAGCPPGCRYGLCPLRQPPPDEPSGQRTVSRAFCRGQYEIADHRRPPWQKRLRKHALQDFWREMERRART